MKERLLGSLLLTGIMLLCSSSVVMADQAAADAVTRAEAGLASRTVFSIVDLAKRLRSEQAMYRMLMPPSADFTLRQACGMVVFDPKAFPETFTTGLIGETIHESPVYTIILVEDPAPRETVIANVDGKEIASVKPKANQSTCGSRGRYWTASSLGVITMTTPVYPLFILELDDHSFREITDASGLAWYERQDIENALYEGWDSKGRHLRLEWDPHHKKAAIIIENGTDAERFREAVEKYVAAVARLKIRPKYMADSDRLIAILSTLSS